MKAQRRKKTGDGVSKARAVDMSAVLAAEIGAAKTHEGKRRALNLFLSRFTNHLFHNSSPVESGVAFEISPSRDADLWSVGNLVMRAAAAQAVARENDDDEEDCKTFAALLGDFSAYASTMLKLKPDSCALGRAILRAAYMLTETVEELAESSSAIQSEIRRLDRMPVLMNRTGSRRERALDLVEQFEVGAEHHIASYGKKGPDMRSAATRIVFDYLNGYVSVRDLAGRVGVIPLVLLSRTSARQSVVPLNSKTMPQHLVAIMAALDVLVGNWSDRAGVAREVALTSGGGHIRRGDLKKRVENVLRRNAGLSARGES